MYQNQPQQYLNGIMRQLVCGIYNQRRKSIYHGRYKGPGG